MDGIATITTPTEAAAPRLDPAVEAMVDEILNTHFPKGVPSLLRPGELADIFRVDPKTVTRWVGQGRITAIRSPGGHHRFHRDEVRALLRRQCDETR
jgi:excisionase family DNA binding protein